MPQKTTSGRDTCSKFLYRQDAITIALPTVQKHWRELKALTPIGESCSGPHSLRSTNDSSSAMPLASTRPQQLNGQLTIACVTSRHLRWGWALGSPSWVRGRRRPPCSWWGTSAWDTSTWVWWGALTTGIRRGRRAGCQRTGSSSPPPTIQASSSLSSLSSSSATAESAIVLYFKRQFLTLYSPPFDSQTSHLQLGRFCGNVVKTPILAPKFTHLKLWFSLSSRVQLVSKVPPTLGVFYEQPRKAFFTISFRDVRSNQLHFTNYKCKTYRWLLKTILLIVSIDLYSTLSWLISKALRYGTC